MKDISKDPMYFDYMMSAVFLKPRDHTSSEHNQAINHMAVFKVRYSSTKDIDPYALIKRGNDDIHGVKEMLTLRIHLQGLLVFYYGADGVPHKLIINEFLPHSAAEKIHAAYNEFHSNFHTKKGIVGVSAGEQLDHWVLANELTASSDRIAKELGKACVNNVYNFQGVGTIASEGIYPIIADWYKGNHLSVIKSANNILGITALLCLWGAGEKAWNNVSDFITESSSSYQGDGGNQANEVGPMGLDSSGNSSDCYPGGDSGVC